MMASLIGCSVEAMIIDNDMLGNIQRVLKGVDVSDDTLSFDEDRPRHLPALATISARRRLSS